MQNRGLFVAAMLLACLSLGSVLGADDATMKDVMARLKALEDKNRDLESKLKQAETTSTRRSSVDKAVDRAMITSEEKLGTVITAPDQFNRPLKIGGYIDVSYMYNANKPDNQLNNLRAFDKYHNSFNVQLAEINFERLPNNPGEAGFRIDFDSGSDSAVEASRQVGGPPPDRLFDLQQAYIEYIAPVGTGITIDAGKFVTWAGYEVVESADNINSSRSLLFTYAIPIAHTGIRATYNVFKDKWKVGLGIVNGWDNLQDENMAKTALFLSDWKPVSWFDWIVTGTVGDEGYVSEQARYNAAVTPTVFNDGSPDFTGGSDTPGALALAGGKLNDSQDSSPRFLVDTSLIFTPWHKWTFALNADYGTESVKNADNKSEYHNWWGVAAYAKWQFAKKWYLAARTELFDENGASRTGVGQTVYEGTVTLDYAFNDAAHVRFEYRHDESSDRVFGKTKGLETGPFDPDTSVVPQRHSQDTFGLNFLYKF